MDKAGFQAIIDSEYWPLVHDFYFCPLNYMDNSWHTELGISEAGELISDYCGDAANRWVLKQLGLADVTCFNVESDGFPLFNVNALLKIVRYCGLVRWSPFIRTLLWSHQRRVIREAMGDEAYQFAVSTASLLLGSWPDDFFEKGELPMEGELIPYRVDCSGLAILSTLMADCQPDVRHRVMLKFAVQYREFFSDTKASPLFVSDRARLSLLFKKVTKVVEPQCLHLLK